VELVPAELAFPLRSVGARVEEQVVVRNTGRASLTVRWEGPAAPFEVEGLPGVLPPGDTALTVRWAPTQPGAFTATLLALPDGEPPARLALTAQAREVPLCPQPPACTQVRYDVESESCVTSNAPDDTPCPEASQCLVDARCRGGQCLGQARACDDGNACTLDVCNPRVGCEQLPETPPELPEGERCRKMVCDPAVGWQAQEVPDGTLCRGGATECDAADVCLAGACVETSLQPGDLCAEASPCQGEGRCSEALVCVRPPLQPLARDYARDTRGERLPNPDRAATYHEFWMDAEGEMTLAGWPSGPPVLGATTPTPLVSSTSTRRCLLWNERLVCGDFPSVNGEAGKVSEVDPATGLPLWTFSLRQARPDLAAEYSPNLAELFATRVASLGTDRLLVLYEGVPRNTPPGQSGRRKYVVVVLGPQGQLVAATPLSDPLLDRADHPHPFGVAADRVGNGYLAISPASSAGQQDGLLPGSPTLLVSVNAAGRVRWQHTYPFTGGELAVGSGLLLPERAGAAYSTVDGLRAGAVEGPGRVGIGPGRVVLPAQEGGTRLSAVRALDLRPAWQALLPQGLVYSTRRLALARWQPRAEVDRLIAVGVASSLPPLPAGSALVGVELEGGQEAFFCPLQPPVGESLGRVDRLHVSGERLGLMDQTTTQGEDPPFAYGQARFTRFVVPGLTDAPVAWSGEFGGPDHDQQEDPPPTPRPVPVPTGDTR
jgi:hypothetical protein